MMLTEQVFDQAVRLTGQLEEKQQELLRMLCAAAVSGLASRLREELTPGDCGADFITAASLLALSGLNDVVQEGALEEFRAGDLTVKCTRTETDLSGLRHHVEQIMRPYMKDAFVFQGV